MHCGVGNMFPDFSKEIQNDLSYNDTFMDLLKSIGMLGLYFTIPAGLLHDRLGDRYTSIIGSLMAGGGLIGMSFVSSAGAIAVLYVIGGFGLGISFICALGASVQIPERYRGLSVSFTGGGLSVSVAYLIAISKLADWKWRKELRLLGILTSSIIFLFSWILPSQKPIKEKESSSLIEKNISLKIILKSQIFLILFLSYFSGVSCGVYVFSETPQLSKFTNNQTSLILSLFSIMNCLGGVFAGFIGDYLQNKRFIPRLRYLSITLLFGSIMFISLGICLSTQNPNKGVIITFLILSGITFGSTLTMIPAIVSEVFPPESWGLNFGIMQFASSIAAIITPLIANSIDISKGYSVLYGIASFLSVSGLFGLFGNSRLNENLD